jgi:hypothetical protein
MRAWFVLLAGVTFASFLGCGSEESPVRPTAPGTVRGTVTRIEDGAAVKDAGVLLLDPSRLLPVSLLAKTDDLGRYRLDGIPPGDYALVVYTDNLMIFDRSHPVIHLSPATTVVQNVRLLASELWSGHGYRIRGRVVNAETGAPVPAAFVSEAMWALDDVSLLVRGLGLPSFGVTDAEGLFSVTVSVFTDEMGNEIALPPISVTRAGFEPATLAGEGELFPPYEIPGLPIPTGRDSSLTVEIRLRPIPPGDDPVPVGAIRGRAVSRLTGQAGPIGIAGLRVAASLIAVDRPDTLLRRPLEAESPVQGIVAVTDTSGWFVVDGLRPGWYVVHPGYFDGDGYLLYEPAIVSVVAADTADAGEIILNAAIRPITPQEGAILSDTTPLFEWEGVAGTVDAVTYNLEYATSALDWTFIPDLDEPRWQVPDEMALSPGAKVRWQVEVVRQSGNDLPRDSYSAFEHPATFVVRD